MQLYKIFYSPKKTINYNKFQNENIIGKNEQVFGLKIEPDSYREYMNSIFRYLQKYKIQQLIMTDYKFLELIKVSNKLNIEVVNVRFFDEVQLHTNGDYLDLKKGLNNGDNELVYSSLLNLVNEGAKIHFIETFIYINGVVERVNLYANGTVSFTGDHEIVKNFNKETSVLDFLVKGYEVLQ